MHMNYFIIAYAFILSFYSRAQISDVKSDDRFEFSTLVYILMWFDMSIVATYAEKQSQDHLCKIILTGNSQMKMPYLLITTLQLLMSWCDGTATAPQLLMSWCDGTGLQLLINRCDGMGELETPSNPVATILLSDPSRYW